MRNWSLMAVAVGVAALGGVAAVAQSREPIEEPAHSVVMDAKGFEVRDYEPMIVAEVTIEGDQMRARRAGFQRLAAYIFAQDRPGDEKGEKIAMTSPVMLDQSEKIAMTSPVLQDAPAASPESAEGPWRIRFVMPSKYTLETLPKAPEDITLTAVPGRRMAAVIFNGFGRKRELVRMEAMLREWISDQKYTASGRAEFAFYDGPWVPGPYRRNEVMIPLKRSAE